VEVHLERALVPALRHDVGPVPLVAQPDVVDPLTVDLDRGLDVLEVESHQPGQSRARALARLEGRATVHSAAPARPESRPGETAPLRLHRIPCLRVDDQMDGMNIRHLEESRRPVAELARRALPRAPDQKAEADQPGEYKLTHA